VYLTWLASRRTISYVSTFFFGDSSTFVQKDEYVMQFFHRWLFFVANWIEMQRAGRSAYVAGETNLWGIKTSQVELFFRKALFAVYPWSMCKQVINIQRYESFTLCFIWEKPI